MICQKTDTLFYSDKNGTFLKNDEKPFSLNIGKTDSKQDGDKDVLFSYLYDFDRIEWLSWFECFDFRAAPSISEDVKPAVSCAFISINPPSSNLDAALSCVSGLAKYLGERKNSFMLSDKAAYTKSKALRSFTV